MKSIYKYILSAATCAWSFAAHAQLPDIVLQSGNYDKNPYLAYNPDGRITGTYTIQAAKSTEDFTAGQFTINVNFPAGAVYAGGAVLPTEFTVLAGEDGSSVVVIGITGTWSGTGPAAIKNFVLPIKIIAAADDEPTGTVLQWNDPLVTENPAGNSTGSPLNVDNVLPVTLVKFAGAGENAIVLLEWATTEETNSDYFEVQHSLDAKNWTGIAKVKSQGESRTLQNYRYTHTDPASGMNYYRLKMVDYDLTFAYSKIENVEMNSAQSANVTIYPNPVRSEASLVVEADSDLRIERIEMVNSLGVALYSANASGKRNAVRVESFPPGIYTTRILYRDGTRSAHKVFVVR